MGISFRSRRAVGLVLAASAAIIALASCGGGSSASSEAPASSSGGDKVMSLTIGVGSASTNYAAYWVAEAKDLFTKNGLKIKVVSYNTSGTTANVVASGQVDLQLYTAPLGLQLAQQGKPISIVDELSTFNASSMAVIGAKDVKSFAELRSASNCRIATTAVGTVPYAYAARYREVEGLDNCKLVPQNSVAPLLASVSSGSTQAGVITYSNALKALEAKEVTLVVNPLEVPPDLAKKLAPTEYPAFVVFGLRSTVQDKAEAVTRFVRALRQANAMLVKMSPEDLGTATAPLEGMRGAPASLLAKAWRGSMSQIPTGSDAGLISPSAWEAALKGFDDWGLPSYDPNSSALSYDEVVDMTYFKKAG